MTAKYFIRPRAEANSKLWQGPFDTTKLKELADRRLFSKELHEFSEDRLNWISARQIWPTLFPRKAMPTSKPVQTPATETTPDSEIKIAASDRGPAAQTAGSPIVEESPDWYCSTDGAQQGPFTISQLRSFVTEGRVQPIDLVWCPQFGEQWVEAQSVPELLPTAGAAGGPVFQDRGTPTSGKTHPLAIASLVCGILGITCVMGLGSIGAIICGHMALSQIARSQPQKSGKWMAIAGLCLGYAMIAMLFIALVVYLALT